MKLIDPIHPGTILLEEIPDPAGDQPSPLCGDHPSLAPQNLRNRPGPAFD